MKIKHALVFYLAACTVAVIGAWLLAYFVAWWAGMALMTLIVVDHVRFTVKRIIQN